MNIKQRNNQYLIPFSNVKITRGATRSVIHDLFRETIAHVPNDLVDLLQNEFKNHQISKVVNYYNDQKQVIMEYINFLINNDYCFYGSKEILDCMDMPHDDFKLNSVNIENSIIELSRNSEYNLQDLLHQLDELNCLNIEFRFLDGDSFLKYFTIIRESISSSSLESMIFIVPFFPELKNFLETSERRRARILQARS